MQCGVLYVHADLCGLLAATCLYNVVIDSNMQMTGYNHGNEIRDATCVKIQTSNAPTRVGLFPILLLYHPMCQGHAYHVADLIHSSVTLY